jgi:hypothetical protein
VLILSVIEGWKLKTKNNVKANKKDKKKDFIGLKGLKPKKRSKTVTLGNASSNNSQSDDLMRYVPEVTGLERTYDEYDRYEDVFDANSDEYLVNKGARIIRSEITITDSQGRNKRLVRRHDNNNYHKQNI